MSRGRSRRRRHRRHRRHRRRSSVSTERTEKPGARERANVVRKMPKEFGPAVVRLKSIKKSYTLESRDDAVPAIRNVTLDDDAPFAPVRRGEFVTCWATYMHAGVRKGCVQKEST